MDKWCQLRKYIEAELIEAKENYETIVERQLERILEHMKILDEQEKSN